MVRDDGGVRGAVVRGHGGSLPELGRDTCHVALRVVPDVLVQLPLQHVPLTYDHVKLDT